jgi:DNA-binding beta-propeller fold protein YncE
VTVLNLANRRVESNLDLGSYERPHDVRVSRDGSRVWVACAPARAVLELDARSGTLLRAWTTDADGGWFVEVTPDDGKIYVPHLEGKRVTVIDRRRGTVRTVLSGGAQSGIDVRPDGREVWAIDHEQRRINIVSVQTDRVVDRIDLASDAFGRLVFTPDGGRAVVVQDRRFLVIDAASRKVISTTDMPLAGKVVSVSPDGRRAIVSNPEDDRVTLLDLTAARVIRSFPTGKTPDGVAWIRSGSPPRARF